MKSIQNDINNIIPFSIIVALVRGKLRVVPMHAHCTVSRFTNFSTTPKEVIPKITIVIIIDETILNLSKKLRAKYPSIKG